MRVLTQFRSGKTFLMQKCFCIDTNMTEKALHAEMDSHLNSDERSKGNKRNGKGNKKLKSGFGSFEIDTPEDRQSSFKPELVKKRQTILADNLSEKIIGIYGMSYRDISSHIKEL